METHESSSLQPDVLDRGTVAGLFAEHDRAERAIVDLDAAGFNLDNLGIAAATARAQRDLIDRTGAQPVEEAARGGSGLLGAIKNLWRAPDPLCGEDLRKVLIAEGLPENEARHFADGVGRGEVLVTVAVRGARTAEALAILARHGADLGFAASIPPMVGEAVPTEFDPQGV